MVMEDNCLVYTVYDINQHSIHITYVEKKRISIF